MVNREWFEELAKRAIDMPPLNNVQFPPSVYYRFLRLLAQELKPSLSVELGVSGGGGSLHLALGNPEGIVIGVDVLRLPDDNLATIHSLVDNWYFWDGDSIESASSIANQNGKVDILFIDTIHTEERTWQEFNNWEHYLSDNAVVCFDDLLRVEMGNFWDNLEGNKVRLDKLHDIAEGGFGIWWK